MASSGNSGNGTGSPCGACKFLRRKCASNCIFAPYFCSEQGVTQFAAIHKVFGASNVSKLLLHVPVADRCEAVVTIAYEAQARIRDPVYGCVSHIFALQQQVACLQAQLMQVKGQLAHQNMMDSSNRIIENGLAFPPNYQIHAYPLMSSPQSSIESVDYNNNEGGGGGGGYSGMLNIMQEIQSKENFSFQSWGNKKRAYMTGSNGDLGELHELALRMMRD